MKLFKEFYHKDWAAKDLGSEEELEVVEVGPGFMGVYPMEGSSGIIFYYQKSFVEYFSIALSLLGVLFLIIYVKRD